jgi:electron transfer flavoprotein alpha subunit
MNVLVFAEQRGGILKKPALEAIGVARALAASSSGTVAAVLLGKGILQLPPALGSAGADRVYLGDDPLFETYNGDAYGLAVGKAAQVFGADAVLFPGTAMGKDLAPRVAARLGIPLLSDVTGFSLVGGDATFHRPIYSGKAMATLAPPAGKPFSLTLRPNAFPPGDAARTPDVVPLESAAVALDLRAVVEKIVTSGEGLLDVAEADIVVSGGRGMKGPDNFGILRDLALALGGAVGASRAAVDAGWIGHEHQVGQTGKVVSPTLYIACGISGAVQHLAGMSTSKVIVAINKDADAPIFKVATYGIVGDLFDVVPKMAATARALKQG